MTLQQTGRAANRTTLVPDPSPLTTMTIGLLGLERLRHSLLTAAIGQIHEIGHSIRESHPFQKCEDCEPRIKRIARIRNFKILKTENGKRKTEFSPPRSGFVVDPKNRAKSAISSIQNDRFLTQIHLNGHSISYHYPMQDPHRFFGLLERRHGFRLEDLRNKNRNLWKFVVLCSAVACSVALARYEI